VGPTIFRAISNFFPSVAARVKSQYGAIYEVENFVNVLRPVASRIKPNRLKSAGQAYKPLVEHFEEAFKQDFML
jgi:hypothetical protein